MEVFGCICLLLLAAGNLAHLPFTALILLEQVKTGWGYGTNWELFALYPWMVELFSLPAVTAGAIFLIMARFRPARRVYRVTCGVLLSLLVLQAAVTNLCFFV